MEASFRDEHFSLKHRVVARVSQMLDDVVYTQRRGLTRGLKRRGGLGFVPQMSPETKEEAFFRNLDLKEQVVYDVGAFQGLTTLWFSRTAKQVITYEPNPTSHARVVENLRLNGVRNVRVRPFAAGSEAGSVELTIDPLMPGAASAAAGLSGQMRSSSGGFKTVSVQVVPIDDDIRENNLPDPDFIKIDIEGFELMALKGLKATLTRLKPRVYMEMHGAGADEKNANVQAIVDFMNTVGIANILHVESGQKITPENATVAAEGHLYCTA